jgi:hypothetical protein
MGALDNDQYTSLILHLRMAKNRLSAIGYWLVLGSWFLAALTACATPTTPTPVMLPLPTAIPFTPFDSLPQQGQVTLVGYLLITNGSAILAPAASVGGTAPEALGNSNTRIWCGDATNLTLAGVLTTTGTAQHALVLASGILDPPGNYGSNGIFAHQLRNPQIQVVAPQEATVSDIRANMEIYRQRVVRVVGWLVLTSDSAVLIDKLGDGGMPAPNAVSLKLHHVPDDPAISAGLQNASGGSVRYGQVQIEGAISDGALIPVTMRLVR